MVVVQNFDSGVTISRRLQGGQGKAGARFGPCLCFVRKIPRLPLVARDDNPDGIVKIAIGSRLDFASAVCFERFTRSSNRGFAISRRPRGGKGNLEDSGHASPDWLTRKMGGRRIDELPPWALGLGESRRMLPILALIVITQ